MPLGRGTKKVTDPAFDLTGVDELRVKYPGGIYHYKRKERGRWSEVWVSNEGEKKPAESVSTSEVIDSMHMGERMK